MTSLLWAAEAVKTTSLEAIATVEAWAAEGSRAAMRMLRFGFMAAPFSSARPGLVWVASDRDRSSSL